MHRKRTILFVDEIHRFTKAQQDAFLPHVEDGTRHAHRRDHREPVVRGERGAPLALPRRHAAGAHRGGGRRAPRPRRSPRPEGLAGRGHARAGRARGARALRVRRRAAGAQRARGGGRRGAARRARRRSSAPTPRRRCSSGRSSTTRRARSTTTSSPRSSSRCAARDPDAAVYCMVRMLEAGEDPRFVLRRMVIFASRGRRQRRPAGARRSRSPRSRRSSSWACPRASCR